jgi:hypothetical protein
MQTGRDQIAPPPGCARIISSDTSQGSQDDSHFILLSPNFIAAGAVT